MTDKTYRILTINPGGTSTKAGIFENGQLEWKANIVHDAAEIRSFEHMADQGPYRKDAILKALADDGKTLDGIDVVVGVGGVGLAGVPYGTYEVNDTMIKDASEDTYAVHPNNLGIVIAKQLADECGAPAYAAGMASAEEFQDLAHIGGFKEIPRRCCVHMLNTKEVALRYAASQDRKYAEMSLVLAHIGSGITVAAHRNGKVVDGTDGVEQEGPMSPNRPGTVKLVPFMKMCYQNEPAVMKQKLRNGGGLMSHLGTDDVLEVKKMIDAGDKYAKLIYDSLLYQCAKWIAMMAGVLEGKVDAIILTGGLMRDNYGADYITKMVKWIAPVAVYPGELEGEALAAAAQRVLEGKEPLLEYTGTPVWDGFDDYRRP